MKDETVNQAGRTDFSHLLFDTGQVTTPTDSLENNPTTESGNNETI